jgi:hypothetical protein
MRTDASQVLLHEHRELLGGGVEPRTILRREPVEEQPAQGPDVEGRANARMVPREAGLHHRLLGERQEVGAYGLEETGKAGGRLDPSRTPRRAEIRLAPHVYHRQM